jgi:uncharacterized protein YcgL (UPF0745 family)
MKKVYSLFLCLVAAHILPAQNLVKKIPATANVVASFDAGKLTQMMSAEEWDKTELGKKLNAGKDSGKHVSINDLGLNLNSTVYYFHTEDDSMHYNCVLAFLDDATKLDKTLGKRELIRLPKNVRKVIDDDSTGYFMWDNKMMVFVNASLKDAYFSNPEVAKNHGLSSYNSYGTSTYPGKSYEYADTVAVAVDTAVIELKEDSMMPAPPSVTDVEVTTDSVASAYTPDESDFDYYADLRIKKSISAKCAGNFTNTLFTKTPAASVAGNKKYTASVNDKAVANIWIDKPMELYTSVMPYNYFFKSPYNLTGSNGFGDLGYKSFAGNVVMDDKRINIHSELEMDDTLAAIQQKIAARKINKEFYRYINSDSMLAYISWSMDTKAYLEEFPSIMERTYGNMGLGISGDEYALAAEFFSFLIDEEAVAKMAKGDGMILFDGVYQQETTYTDYTYDENFNATPVTKTKHETIPRFMLMMSSEENKLAKKLEAYGIKKNVLTLKEGFYEIEIPKSPMRFYFMYKNDIFFLTNSLKNIQEISKGSFKSNLAAKEMEFISDHSMTMYINPKNIAGRLSAAEIGGTESLAEMINVFNKMGEVKMQVNPIKNNISSGDFWIDVPEGNKNSLTFFIDLFKGMTK